VLHSSRKKAGCNQLRGNLWRPDPPDHQTQYDLVARKADQVDKKLQADLLMSSKARAALKDKYNG
jgi:hypothetical protein